MFKFFYRLICLPIVYMLNTTCVLEIRPSKRSSRLIQLIRLESCLTTRILLEEKEDTPELSLTCEDTAKRRMTNPGRVAHQTRYRHSDLGLLASVLSYVSHVRLFVTLWTVALQAPLAVGFSRQECWSELPYPPPGDLPDPGIELVCLCLLH